MKKLRGVLQKCQPRLTPTQTTTGICLQIPRMHLSSNGYLLQTSSEAGSIPPESWPTSGKWHPAGLNLGKLFDCAQGGAVRRETMLTLAAKRRSTRGARDDAVPEKDLASVEVILLCMQPHSVFSEWWSLQEKRRHVGLSQRFLLSFGCSGPIPALELKRCVPDFALPFLSKGFAWVLQTMGPQVPINSSLPTWRTAPHHHHILDAARRIRESAH